MDIADRSLLVSLACRFDPRIVVPDLLAQRAFDRLGTLLDMSVADERLIRESAGWLLEDR